MFASFARLHETNESGRVWKREPGQVIEEAFEEALEEALRISSGPGLFSLTGTRIN